MEQGPETVMRFFNSFVKRKVVLTKMEKVSNHKHSEPISIGTTISGELQYMPKVGESFNIEKAWVTKQGDPYGDRRCSLWCTSVISKFLSGNMFQTKNSIYKYEILN